MDSTPKKTGCCTGCVTSTPPFGTLYRQPEFVPTPHPVTWRTKKTDESAASMTQLKDTSSNESTDRYLSDLFSPSDRQLSPLTSSADDELAKAVSCPTVVFDGADYSLPTPAQFASSCPARVAEVVNFRQPRVALTVPADICDFFAKFSWSDVDFLGTSSPPQMIPEDAKNFNDACAQMVRMLQIISNENLAKTKPAATFDKPDTHSSSEKFHVNTVDSLRLIRTHTKRPSKPMPSPKTPLSSTTSTSTLSSGANTLDDVSDLHYEASDESTATPSCRRVRRRKHRACGTSCGKTTSSLPMVDRQQQTEATTTSSKNRVHFFVKPEPISLSNESSISFKPSTYCQCSLGESCDSDETGSTTSSLALWEEHMATLEENMKYEKMLDDVCAKANKQARVIRLLAELYTTDLHFSKGHDQILAKRE